jgi:hypothetical protein
LLDDDAVEFDIGVIFFLDVRFAKYIVVVTVLCEV